MSQFEKSGDIFHPVILTAFELRVRAYHRHHVLISRFISNRYKDLSLEDKKMFNELRNFLDHELRLVKEGV